MSRAGKGNGLRQAAVSAPGSLMLFGEHAVLHGEPALVCAIHRRLRVAARTRLDGQVLLRSALGDLRFPASTCPEDHRFAFVLEALRVAGIPSEGLELRIQSDFSSKIGFGSSAAVTVATLAVLDRLHARRLIRRSLFCRAREVIRKVQGVGSGADAAASVWGGALMYRQASSRIRRLPANFSLIAAYSGHKTPTPEVIRKVDAFCALYPDVTKPLFRLMGDCSRQAAAALARGDLERVGRLMDVHHGLHDALGVNTQGLACLAFALRADPGILGAKISGSGLGDCVIGLGRLRHHGPGALTLEIAVDPEGVRFESMPEPFGTRRIPRKAVMSSSPAPAVGEPLS